MSPAPRFLRWSRRLLWLLVPGLLGSRPALAQSTPTLHLEEIIADSESYHVVSTLVIGSAEVICFDAQNRLSDGRRVAEHIAATGRRLTGIFVSHPDEDHYFGALAILDRFPGTPIYMTPAAIAEFNRTAEGMRARVKQRFGAEIPDSLFHPTPYPAAGLAVDGVPLVLIADLQGDVLKPTNSALWIPSIRAVLAGDIVFNGVYPYLAASSPASRQAWHRSLDSLAALHPALVVAGHKASADLPDSPTVLDFMRRYLDDFDAARAGAETPQALAATVQSKYPDLTVAVLLRWSAMTAFQQ